MRAEETVEPADRVEHLHEIRKAAKRLRYSADAAVPVLNGPAEELSARAKKLQTVLGDHRDAIEAMTTIRARAAAASTRGIVTADYDRLYDAESDAARKALDQYPAATEFLRHKYGH